MKIKPPKKATKWWVYKCNSKYRGDWCSFFDEHPKDRGWGNASEIRGLDELKKGNMIIAYQTDHNELVGICQILRFSGEKRTIHLKFIESIGQKVRPLKKGDPQIAKIAALQPGEVKTLYEISAAEATLLLDAARASKLGHTAASNNRTIQSEKIFIEGEKRAAEASVRDPQLRAAAKEKYGLTCFCCGFEFAHFYGAKAKDVAIVHHLSKFKGKRRRTTVQDVRVVCANCHQVIHVRKKPIEVKDLKEQISSRWTRWSDVGVKRLPRRK